MNIGLDIMGGDYAPKAAIEGVAHFFNHNPNTTVHLILIGIKEAAEPYFSLLDPYKDRYTFIAAGSFIEMNEHPTKALKEKQDSSIVIGFGLLQQKKIDAFISAGNTGAMLVGSMYSVKPLPNVARPTIGSPVPCHKGGFNLLLDVGANADCKPEHLEQFAVMGTIYMEHTLGIAKPKVGLLNIGEEEGKGNILTQAAYSLLKNNDNINFIGNIEGRDILTDKANIIVCEGFTGNVVLKLAESFYDILKEDSKGELSPFVKMLNYEEYGGLPILGINAPVIIGHGISNDTVFSKMIKSAEQVINTKFIEILRDHFSKKSENA
jgi:glycerol-3-phosphate acyltransferase PlsX